MQLVMMIIITAVLMFQIVVLLSANNVLIDIRTHLKELLEKNSKEIYIEPLRNYSKNDLAATQKFYNDTLKTLKNYQTPTFETKDAPDLFFSSRVDAEAVLDGLKKLLTEFNVAMLLDLYDLVGMPTNFEDSRWGWDDLSSAVAIVVEDEATKKMQWTLSLPKMKRISDMHVRVSLNDLLGNVENTVDKNAQSKEKYDFDI